jgi:sulfonate transport system permease protein
MTAQALDSQAVHTAPWRMTWLGPWAGLYLPGALLFLWWLASANLWLPSNILPSPAVTASSFVDLIASAELAEHLGASLRRVSVGFAAGAVIGLTLGAAMGFSRAFDAWIGPLFRGFAQIPSLAWIPLLMMILGIGEALKFVILAKAAMVPVAIASATGIRNISKDYVEVGRVLRLSRTSLVGRIILPGALPSIFSGLRQGLAHVWTSLIIVEMMASADGVGYLMNWSRLLFQLDVVMVCIVVVGAIGFSLDYTLKRVEIRLQAWRG